MELDFSDIYEVHLNKANILKKISSYDIFHNYLGDFEVGKIMHSPLRVDPNPSFGIYVSKYTGDLLYNDFKLGSGNCFDFIMNKYNCSYGEALAMINRDFNLKMFTTVNLNTTNIKPKPVITGYKPKLRSRIKIKVKVREWLERDKNYWWNKYNINISTLNFYQVYPLIAFWLDSQRFYPHKLCYGYYYEPGIFKIYQPMLKINQGKWFSNINTDIKWQGFDQLPDEGDILFITSSLKDVMVLYELNYSAIAPHTEHQKMTDELYLQLKSRFNKIIVYYDNDEAGVLHSTNMCNNFNLDYINNPKEYPKDPSDFIDKYNQDELRDLIVHLLNNKKLI